MTLRWLMAKLGYVPKGNPDVSYSPSSGEYYVNGKLFKNTEETFCNPYLSAIKEVRTLTNMGLVEAKNLVDSAPVTATWYRRHEREVEEAMNELRTRLALYETPHKHPVCVSCSKPVKRGQKYSVKFVQHEDCGGNNGE